MRRVLALILVAGCGRIAFDERWTAGDGSVGDGGGSGDSSTDGAVPPFTVYVVSGDGVVQSELMTLDLTIGRLTHVAFIPASLGNVGGLAYWDANTIYGMANNSFIQITLAPFSATMLTAMPGTWSAIERDGTNLIGVDQDGDVWGRFAPAAAASPTGTMALGIDAIGGDVASSGGLWYWYSNTGAQLYILDAAGPIVVGSPIALAPFISGMTSDPAGNLYVTSADTDSLYPISKTTGQLGTAIPLTTSIGAYDLLAGDMTRTP